MGGVEYQVTKVDPADPETKGMVYQVHKVSEEVAATLGGKVYRARIIKDPTEPTVAGKVYQIVLIDDPDDPAVKGKVYNAILTGGSEAVVVGPAVSPLALDDAVADTMEYVKAYGGTEQRNLPDGYTQLEYIVFDATQVIDTGFTPDNNSRIESKCYRTGEDCWFYGASPSNPRITLYHSRTGTCRWGNQSLSNVGFVADTEYTIIEDKNGLSINGVNTPWTSGTAGDFTCDRSLTIGNNNGSTGTRYFAGNFYYMKIYDDGVLVRDFVPCKNASNVVGLYDRVNGVFYTDTGLAAGPDAVPSPDAPMDIISNNGALKARHQSGLPLGYTLLDYIESNGTQYIDLGYKGNGNTKVEVKFKYHTATSASGSGRVFGSRNAATVDAFAIGSASGTASTNSTVAFFFGNQSYLVTDKSLVLDEWLSVIFDKTTHSINGTDYGNPYNDETFETPQNLKLFGFDNNGSVGVGYVDIAYCKLWNNGVLVRDLIPAKNNSNIIGMYDLVSGQFFTNQGTDDFIASTAVSDPVEIYTDGTVETINVHGKNLFDNNSSNFDTGLLFVSGTGNVTSNQNYRTTKFIPLKAGNYVVSGKSSYTDTGTITLRANAYDSNQDVYGTFLFNDTLARGNSDWTRIFTMPIDGYVKISVRITDYDIQLELSSTATAYEPYYDGGTATAEMLLKVGDYQDVQSILDGVVTRNVGVKVLDGTENWNIIPTAYADGTHRIYTNDFGYNQDTNAISTHFVEAPLADRDLPTGQQGKMYHSGLSFHLRATQFTSLLAVKQWLADQYAAGHPVIVIYPLATPTTESVAGQTLQVQDGDNVLEITQASLDGLELEAEYEKEA